MTISQEEAKVTLEIMEENFANLYVQGQRNDFAVDWCCLVCIREGKVPTDRFCLTGVPEPITASSNSASYDDFKDRVFAIERYLQSWFDDDIEHYMIHVPNHWVAMSHTKSCC